MSLIAAVASRTPHQAARPAALSLVDADSLKRYAVIGLFSVFGLMGGLLLWAGLTRIEGAIVVSGTLIVEGFDKKIQHGEGGTVVEILADNEDIVGAGDPLIVLDDTAIRANLAVVDARRNEALIVEGRLNAELAGETRFDLPASLREIADDPIIATHFHTQLRLLTSFVQRRLGQVDQTREQILQSDYQISGLDIQRQATQRQIDILRARLVNVAKLFERKLIEAAQVAALNLQVTSAEGELGKLVAAIAQGKAGIAEKRLRVEEINGEATKRSLDELQRVNQVLAEVSQQKLALEAQLAQTVIRAPQAGAVHESVVHTLGGVVGAGQTLMTIVPLNGDLLAGIAVEPNDVDDIAIGDRVRLRLLSFDQRTTPDLGGEITTISADLVVDERTGRGRYSARVRIDAADIAALPAAVRLLPGMPAQVFIITGERSALDYLIKPFADAVRLAFRER